MTSRYFPQAGVSYFGMTSLLNPETGQALINVTQIMADPKWLADVPASAANPLATKVGWFDLNNINCGLLGMPLGFLVIYVVSLMGKEPSKEMQGLIDEIRKPRGGRCWRKRPDRHRGRSRAGPSGAPLLFEACRWRHSVIERLRAGQKTRQLDKLERGVPIRRNGNRSAILMP